MTEAPAATLSDRLFAILQYLLPKHLLSRFIYAITRSETIWVRNAILKIFLRGYRVTMQEAVEPNPFAYPSFNAFFTRALKTDARPIDSAATSIACPVDGTLSQCGPLRDNLLIQAKGHYYSLEDLLGDAQRASAYRNGTFACIYLAPYNYHRIHMPLAGVARDTIYIPGELFSVNAATARAVPRVFARNERLICEFDTIAGRMAVILIGALFVGSIETVHCGEVNPPPRRGKRPVRIDKGIGQRFEKGAELGRFNMGSTVILLFEKGRADWNSTLFPDATVQLGSAIGLVRS
ncbi:MAG TPA: archaetidylserine decarboxylase [Steroidobacteraceae bacterium]|nr:archaetidylserine decarboxylase [Steroidobacteraceae bacterium]